MIRVKNLNQALIEGCKLLKKEGVARKTRGFDCIEVPYPVLICIENPRDRFVTVPERKWNKTLGWVESLWLWQGINSMDMVGSYVKNLYNFSDDGKFMRAGYGPRMRGYNGELEDYTYDKPQFNTKGEMEFGNCVDQVKFVIEKLKQDPNSRQASITIHDPVKDNFELDGSLKKTKDTPCTRTIQFMMVDGKLDCTVTMRSNDCFTYETKIPLLNGEVWELGRLAEEKANESFWVYSRNKDGEIVPGLAHHPRKTKKVKQIMEVTIDNGEIIRCTPDHRFMLKDGSFKEIKDIELNESLSPLYRKNDKKGYESVLCKDGKWVPTHKMSYCGINGEKKETCNVIHHKDFNKRNNNPENLVEMGWKEHIKLHNDFVDILNDKLWNEKNEFYHLYEESRKKVLKAVEDGNYVRWNEGDVELKKKIQSEVMKNVNDWLWNNREGFREYIKPIQSENGRKNLKKLWNNEDFRKNVSESSRKRMNSPEVKEKMRKITSERNVKNWKDEEYRNKITEILRKQWNDDKKEEYKHLMRERSKRMWQDEEFVKMQKEVQSKLSKEKWANEEHRKIQEVSRRESKYNKVRNIFIEMENQGLVFNEENFDKVRLSYGPKTPSIKYLKKEFGGLIQAKAELIGNHKIISKRLVEEEVDVYDLTVEEHHNFALESGVFVHNCIWGLSAVNVFNFSLLQEIIAMVLGVPVGKYYHFINNFHYYSDLEEMVNSVSTLNADDYYKHYEYPDNDNITLEEVDYQIRYIAELEECSRMGKAINEDTLNKLKPLFKDWFYAIHKRNNKGVEVEFNNPQMSEIYK